MLCHLFHFFKCRSSFKFRMATWYSMRSISDIFLSTCLRDGLIGIILHAWIACLNIIVMWLIMSEELSSIFPKIPNSFSSSLKVSFRIDCKSFQMHFTNSHSMKRCLKVSICLLQNVQFGVSFFIPMSYSFLFVKYILWLILNWKARVLVSIVTKNGSLYTVGRGYYRGFLPFILVRIKTIYTSTISQEVSNRMSSWVYFDTEKINQAPRGLVFLFDQKIFIVTRHSGLLWNRLFYDCFIM